jgi:transposase-like protein
MATTQLPRPTRAKAQANERDQRKASFVEFLSSGGSVTASARSVGIDRHTVYNWRKADPDFADAWDDATERGADVLEDRALALALQDDDLGVASRTTIALLKSRRPKAWSERGQQTSISIGDQVEAQSGAKSKIAIRFVGEPAAEDDD